MCQNGQRLLADRVKALYLRARIPGNGIHTLHHAGNRAVDGAPLIKPEALQDGLRVRSGDYKDPIFGVKVNRALGVVVAGGDGLANYRGFGKTNSPYAFVHGGAGGQIGWADPATGISIGYCTNGFDRNDVRQGRRGVALSSLAAVCEA